MPDLSLLWVDAAPRGVGALFTTRSGGVSGGPFDSLNLGCTVGDDEPAVRANRHSLAEMAGFDAGRAVSLQQVHGADLIAVDARGGEGRFVGALSGLADADAAATSAPGVALMVQGADCVPVLAWQGNGSRVAAAHAGWRGMVAGVVGAMVGGLDDPPSSCGAAIGPCIGPCCYPVDDALRARMRDAFGADVVVGDAVDLRLAARRALVGAGLQDAAIVDVGGCTSCDGHRFFSYRRDGARTGRQAGVIWMREGA